MTIFDPLSIIIKLSMISKKSIGTKISIKNCIVIIQEPSYYQGFLRYLNNDSKLDIINLLYPIKLACEIYLNITNLYCQNFKVLFRTAQNGISLLINTYNKYPSTIYHLKYANLIIDTYINNLLKQEVYIMYKNNLILLYSFMDNLKTNSSTKTLTRNSSNSLFKKSISSNSLFSESNFSRASSNNNDEQIEKKFHRVSSLTNLHQPNDVNDSIKSVIYRYGSTGYFTFEPSESNIKEKIYDDIKEIIDKLDYYNVLLVDTNISIYDNNNINYSENLINKFIKIWCNYKINKIFNLINTYTTLNKIEQFMDNIDNLVSGIIINS